MYEHVLDVILSPLESVCRSRGFVYVDVEVSRDHCMCTCRYLTSCQYLCCY